MSFSTLDMVVLCEDHPESGLKSGDLGVVVQRYGDLAVEVEFVTAAGHTEALVTLSVDDVRSVADTDLMSVRSIRRSA